MNRPIVPLVLVILLIGSVVFGVYEWNQTQQLAKDKADLKQQLDVTAERLRQTEDETRRLRDEVSQTQNKITELNARIAALEQNITQLRRQLEEKALRQGAITVPLTVLWNPSIDDRVNVTQLHQIVDYMNTVQWAKFKVYFFIYHAEPQAFIPTKEQCLTDGFGWGRRALNLYLGRDIIIAITPVITGSPNEVILGCAIHNAGILAVAQYDFVVQRDRGAVYSAPHTWTHEIEHAMVGITDDEIEANGADLIIPLNWMTRIQAAAKQFQMPLPEGYVAP
jgi:uncharacterized small protein (DUF1192 family)